MLKSNCCGTIYYTSLSLYTRLWGAVCIKTQQIVWIYMKHWVYVYTTRDIYTTRECIYHQGYIYTTKEYIYHQWSRSNMVKVKVTHIVGLHLGCWMGLGVVHAVDAESFQGLMLVAEVESYQQQ